MPSPFQPKTVLLGQGVRRDLGELAVDNQGSIRVAQNVVFTKTSALRSRPSPVSQDGTVQAGVGSAPLADIAAARALTKANVPTGVLAIQAPNSDGAEAPMLAYHGLSLARAGTQWTAIGVPGSMRQTKSTTAFTATSDFLADTLGGVSVGPSLMGSLVTRVGGFSAPFVNDLGTFDTLSTSPFVPDSLEGRITVTVAGSGMFWVDTGGQLYAAVHPSPPTAVTSNFASGAATGYQAIAAVDSTGGNYYLAVQSATAGRVTLYEINANTAAVVQSLNINGLGTVAGVALSRDPVTGVLALYWHDTATTSIKSRIYTAAFTTNAAFDVTTTATAGTDAKFVAGNLGTGLSMLMQTNADRDLQLVARTYASNSAPVFKTYYGVTTNAFPYSGWDPLFGGIVIDEHVYFGAIRWDLVDPANLDFGYTGQWMVFDYVDALGYDPRVVAAGPAGGTPDQSVSNAAQAANGGLVFGVYEGSEFSARGITKAAARRINLVPQPTALAHGHDLVFTTNARANSYDGGVHQAHGFTEDFPYIAYDTTAGAAAGSLTAGSYTVQATWEMINAKGQTVRSGASNIVTYTVAGGKSLNITVTIPQLFNYDMVVSPVTVRLWSTEVNPTAGASLYLVGEVDAETGAVLNQGHVQILYDTIDPDDPQLYTGGNVVDDMAPPAGDRGVAFAGGRLWVADQNHLYASKILRDNRAPAWNTNDARVLALPSAVGTVQALLGLDADLLVVGSTGLARVYGPGYDDLGSGAGWALEVTAHIGVGETSPRAVLDTPQGPLVVTREGEVWLIQNFVPTVISKPVSDQEITRGPRDLALLQRRLVTDGVYGTSSTNMQVVIPGSTEANRIRLLDLDVGAWATWTVPTQTVLIEGVPTVQQLPPLYAAGVNGQLWTQSDEKVFAYTGDPGADAASVVIETSILRPADGAPRGWGRIKGISVHATDPATPYTLQVEVLGDSKQRVMLDKDDTVSPPTGSNTPASSAPDFTCTHQNCSYAVVRLTATPGIVEWSAIDLWVSSGSEPAPASKV